MLRLISAKKLAGAVDSNFSREKMSILSAVKLCMAYYAHDSIVWIPISLEEMLRVSGGAGYSPKDGLLSAKSLGFEKGPTSDDILLVGIEGPIDDIKVYLHPVEVKIGQNPAAVISKAHSQVLNTYNGLWKALWPDEDRDSLECILSRNFLMQLVIVSCEKMQLYNVYPNEQWDTVVDEYREALLNEQYRFSESLDDMIGKGTIISFKSDALNKKGEVTNEVCTLEFPEKLGSEYMIKSANEIEEDLDASRQELPDRIKYLYTPVVMPASNTQAQLTVDSSAEATTPEEENYSSTPAVEEEAPARAQTESEPITQVTAVANQVSAIEEEEPAEDRKGMEILFGTDISNGKELFWLPNDRGVDMRCFSEAKQEHRILDETRRSIIDALLALGNLTGDKEYHEFAKLVCPSLDEGTISEIARHMDRFDDWPESYLLDTVIDYLHLPDEDFCFLLEQYVNPNIHHSRWIAEEERRGQIHNSELVKVINRYLSHDEYQLEIKDSIGDKDFYQCVSSRAGVQGTVKNIIFAARYKPEIVFDDALNNDIRITKNADKCLIYDRAIPQNGLLWSELVEWFSAKTGSADNVENRLLRRLCDSLDDSFKATGAKSGPETWLMQAYYELMKSFGMDFPALLPQVYLYYDPLTQTQRGYKLFEHQKMDFLMVFSHRNRVVIEIDGKQHYAEGDIASPRLYSEMVKAQRELSLYGYDVYRFGGYEFANAAESDRVKQELLKKLKEFFVRLFQKYNVLER